MQHLFGTRTDGDPYEGGVKIYGLLPHKYAVPYIPLYINITVPLLSLLKG